MSTRTPCSIKLLVIGASLRSGSLNNRLATLVARVVERNGGEADSATMGDFDCPPYDQDIEGEHGIPDGAQSFCARLKAADAFIIASPEFAHKVRGGTITPKRGKFLALPLRAEAYAAGSPREWDAANGRVSRRSSRRRSRTSPPSGPISQRLKSGRSL